MGSRRAFSHCDAGKRYRTGVSYPDRSELYSNENTELTQHKSRHSLTEGDPYTLGNITHMSYIFPSTFNYNELRPNDSESLAGGIAIRTATELEYLLDRLEKDQANLQPAWREQVAEAIAKVFNVKPDEVAVLGLLPAGKSLEFVLPAKLRAVGTIPLTSTTALAARTARERRADVVNNFASSRHASVFEGVPLGRTEGNSIQKIMSAPILRGDKVIGVTQISRKGDSATSSGPDFSSRDLSELQGLNSLLGRILALSHFTQ
jgi:hypothetical protein